jgi:hypothetical protein
MKIQNRKKIFIKYKISTPKTYCILFLLIISIPLVFHLFNSNSDTRLIDRRNPQVLPPLPKNLEELSAFKGKFASYLNDNFGFRAQFITANHYLHKNIGASAVPGVMVGKNGWQYLSNANDITNQYRGVVRYSQEELDRAIDNIEAYRDWLEKQNIKFALVVIPNQQTIYPEFLPDYVNRVNPETQLDQLKLRLRERNSTIKLVDIRSDLISKKSKGILYTKSEGHWNELGALVGFSSISKELHEMISSIKIIDVKNYGINIGKRDFVPVSFNEAYPEVRNLKGEKFSIKAIPTPNPNETLQLIKSESGAGPRALFIGDSFLGMAPQFMAASFGEVLEVHHGHSGYAVDIVKEYKPDIVVFELVERFLNGAFKESANIPPELPLPLSKYGVLSPDRGGFVDYINSSSDTIEFRGWAYDNSFKSPPSKVVLYINGNAVAAIAPSFDRPDIVPKEISNKRAGFDLRVPRTSLSAAAKNQVDIVAFFGPEAHSIRRIEVVPSELAKLPNISK